MDGDKTNLITSAEAAGVAKASVTDVLTARTGRPGLCHATGLNRALKPDGFCWDDDDDRSDYSDSAGGWMPQGFAGSHAATADGLYAGRSLTATAWYHGTYVKDREPTTVEDYSRISIAESTGSKVTYGHVALVEPVNGGFMKLKYESRADGVAWHGNRLFVANGAELQVFDLTRLWRMNDTTSATTGLASGKTSARYHIWALPLVARYSTVSTAQVDNVASAYVNNNPRACAPGTGELCLSSLSIDRSSQTPTLVSVENKGTAGARIVRWPLSALGTGTPTTVASEAKGYVSPVWGIQGTATDGTSYYMSGTCPSYWPGGTTLHSCIHVAKPGEAPHVLTQAPQLTQGLSWDPHAKRLWGANEALVDSSGPRRVVFSIEPGAGATTSDGWSWLTNFHQVGSVCATPQGDATANGTPITVWPCTGAESQRWRYENGLIVHRASGKCITPEGNGASVNGALLTLWTCNPASDVQRFSPSADGSAVNAYGKAITPKGNSFASGVWLTLWTKGSPTPDAQDWVVKGF
ncbi:RICIN domain-containing protein [Streptomyces sp. ISL-100]|uniref:RICIN domain-containing protein n=1 Tax=Streptomyces sp. ISL-100 TaxID=2819173 RepID=UPI001BE862C0|nr:ricin-type beta-trefoil lectin domain protein [Streptomyces sp. ISL-100]MBT2401214.1 RICIN domain-containing protein [Streptomyces sp. ISL-100]